MLLPLFALAFPSLSILSHDASADAERAFEIARMRAHYAAAEHELRAHDTTALGEAQRARREELLRALAAYRERGEFGLNRDFPGARMPYFVDAGGRRCAVAELLHVSGQEALVQSVASAANQAWIVDLHDEPRFQAWLRDNGLSLAEAARIQFPAMTGPRDGGSGGGGGSRSGGGSSGGGSSGGGTGTIGGATGNLGTPAGGSWSGPGDRVPSGGGGSGPTGPTGGAGGLSPSTGSANPAPGASTPTGGGLGSSLGSGSPTTPTLAMEVDDGWWLWWEYNKTEFLRPNSLAFWRVSATDDDAAGAWRKRVIGLRTELSADVVRALADEDSNVRAAAVDALAKIGGSEAVAQLRDRLDDKSTEVRHHAILALGASGAPEAVEPLLQILRNGKLEGRFERISPIASAVAICALGLGRRSFPENGFDEFVDAAVVDRLEGRTGNERESIACGAFIYQRLAPCSALEEEARKVAEDRDESPSVRCRAIEALSTAKDKKTLSKLQHFLSSARMDERRSAALALGIYGDALALPALQSAFELESEPLTRGFILVSIGRRGGDEAREFLIKTLAKSGSSQRPWCALALGLLARDDDTPAIRTALREGVGHEKNRSALGAWWLALGLARDLEARSILRAALNSGADQRQKMYAATALALIGDTESAALVRERMRAEESAFLKVAYASALGLFGHAQDAEPMVQVLADLRDPTLQGLAAAALAFHGSREALDRLAGIAKDDGGSRIRRAAAIEGLSMMLGTTRPYTFGDISRQANYTVFSDWVKGMLQVSL